MTVDLVKQNYSDFLITIEKESLGYSKSSSSLIKKDLGQFFTDASVAKFMANMFSLTNPITDKIKVLDCGAGHGILSIALLYRLVFEGYESIALTLYEIDDEVLIKLNENLLEFTSKYPHVDFAYTIKNKNFILDNIDEKFDYIISNPPYFKINKQDNEALVMSHVVHGQPNIYMLFMVKSSDVLKADGEMVFITPRSFTSGSYFKKFREYILKNLSLNQIHIFNSRREHFKNESILQETIITKFKKNHSDKIVITSSEDSQFFNINTLDVTKKMIVENERMIIGIPTSYEDLRVLEQFNEATCNFKDMGYKISTGKVVTFRSREFISIAKENHKNVPLLWMQNFKKEELIFPLNNKKEQYIQNIEETKKLLIPNENYIVIKRFSSKEQHRRVNIGYIFKEFFSTTHLGLENHLNYLYREDRKLKKDEMKKLGTFLTSKEVDQYFRVFNGNTQVNAADILMLPVPNELFKGEECQG